MSAGKRLYFRKVIIRLGVVALLALCLQAAAIKAPLGDDDFPRRILIVVAYLLLLIFAVSNLARPGFVVIGAGLAFNFLGVIANGGLMAITPETVMRSGPLPGDAVLGQWLPGSKDVLLERADVHLWFFTDRLVWEDVSSVFRAFSIGDVIIVVGLALILVDILMPRWQRTPPRDTLPDAGAG